MGRGGEAPFARAQQTSPMEHTRNLLSATYPNTILSTTPMVMHFLGIFKNPPLRNPVSPFEPLFPFFLIINSDEAELPHVLKAHVPLPQTLGGSWYGLSGDGSPSFVPGSTWAHLDQDGSTVGALSFPLLVPIWIKM